MGVYVGRNYQATHYHIDVVTQIDSDRLALRQPEERVLQGQLGHCVEYAINSGNKAEQRRKIEELMAVVSRTDR